MLIQQGDVLLKKIEEHQAPAQDEFQAISGGKYVMAEGELTGHAHVAHGKALLVAYVYPGQLAVRSQEPFKVVHQEHECVEVPAGTWLVEKVREYDHFEGTAIPVGD